MPRNITTAQVQEWKKRLKKAAERKDHAIVFLRGVDIKLAELDRQREAILASVPKMERQKEHAHGKIAYYERNIDRYEKTAKARKKLAEAERELRALEAQERLRSYGRNIAQ